MKHLFVLLVFFFSLSQSAIASVVTPFDIEKMENYCTYIKTLVTLGAAKGVGKQVQNNLLISLKSGTSKFSEFERPRLAEKIDRLVDTCVRTAKSTPVSIQVLGTVSYSKYDFHDKNVGLNFDINDRSATAIVIPSSLIKKWRIQLKLAGIPVEPAYYYTISRSGFGDIEPKLNVPIGGFYLTSPMSSGDAEKLSQTMGNTKYPAKFLLTATNVGSPGVSVYMILNVIKIEPEKSAGKDIPVFEKFN